MGTKEELATVEVMFPADHIVLIRRDHHILTYLRAVSKLTGGSVGFPVEAIDKLWQDAYELGIECGCALVETAKKAKGKRPV